MSKVGMSKAGMSKVGMSKVGMSKPRWRIKGLKRSTITN